MFDSGDSSESLRSSNGAWITKPLRGTKMRITTKQLQNAIDELNEATGQPLQPWVKTYLGFRAGIGCYHLAGAYGGYQLHQMVNEGGGVHDVFSLGYVSKRELYNLICAMVQGVYVGHCRAN